MLLILLYSYLFGVTFSYINVTEIPNPVANVLTNPNNGSCGQTNQTINYKGDNNYQCSFSCPSISRTYPDKQQQNVSKIYIINSSSKLFGQAGCSKTPLNNSQCFIYNEVIAHQVRFTHSLWIKPQLKNLKG